MYFISGNTKFDNEILTAQFTDSVQDFYGKACPVFEGDALMEKRYEGPVAAIKIDVEGAESEVIEGLKNTIIKHKPIIMCEILPVYDPNNSMGMLRLQRQINIEHVLEELRYKIHRILIDGTLIPKESIEVHSDLQLTNYIFINEDDIRYLI